MNPKNIRIDTSTIVRFWLVLIAIVVIGIFLYSAKHALIIICLSIFLALALRPLVRSLNNFFVKHFHFNRSHQKSSAVIAYLLIIAVVVAIIAIVGPVVVDETSKFIVSAPETFENVVGGWEGINHFGESIGVSDLKSEIISAVQNLATSLTSNFGSTIFTGISSIADAIAKTAFVLILTLLFLLEGPEIIDRIFTDLGEGSSENSKSITAIHRTISRMANVVSTYVSRQCLVAIIDGFATMLIILILTFIFGLSTSLFVPLGLITFLFYLIPMFGQLIGGTIVTIILAFSNPLAALIFAIIYIIYANIENNLISPKIQGEALNLPVVVVLSALIIGTYTLGLLGALIAVPITGCIKVLIEDYPTLRSAID